MSAPQVSVVVPVFNGLPYLREAYASILAQTYENIEIVLVDGGSSDGSREWIRTIDDPRVIVASLPPGTPAATTWTEASARATGDFVKLLCQDDLIHPDAIAKQVGDLTAYRQAGMAAAQRDIISASGRVLYRNRGCSGVEAGLVDGHHALTTALLRAQNIFGEPLAVLFRRDVLQQHLPWNDTYPFMLDLELYTRVLLEHPVVIRKESIGAFRVSTSSWSTRLVASQRDQFAAWQRDVEIRFGSELTSWDRRRASGSLWAQTQLRRAAYAWLNWRKDLD